MILFFTENETYLNLFFAIATLVNIGNSKANLKMYMSAIAFIIFFLNLFINLFDRWF
jgi:hypothetical protein